jgi:hypothetical protein
MLTNDVQKLILYKSEFEPDTNRKGFVYIKMWTPLSGKNNGRINALANLSRFSVNNNLLNTLQIPALNSTKSTKPLLNLNDKREFSRKDSTLDPVWPKLFGSTFFLQLP